MSSVYRVRLTRTALEWLRRLEKREREIIIRRLDDLTESPRQRGKPLVGPLQGFYAMRVAGRYRVVYRVVDDIVEVVVVGVGIRRAGDSADIYERLRKLLRAKLLE